MTALGRRLAARTGLPGWATVTLAAGLAAQALTIAGVYWDVAWHVDLGRDQSQITPAHLTILAALGLIVAAGVAGIAVANLSGFTGGLRWRNLAVPWSALLVALGGFGAFAGMPLDELWHRHYGVDLTMWTPSHLVMIAGGNLAALGLWLVLAEAGVGAGDGLRSPLWPHLPWGWWAHLAAAGCVFAQLHVFTGEFDFGVPLFPLLLQPVHTAAAAGVVLVAARLVLGPGGAVAVAVSYAGFRLAGAALVGAGLGHSPPWVPLYAASAA